jgi:hypothetical protein
MLFLLFSFLYIYYYIFMQDGGCTTEGVCVTEDAGFTFAVMICLQRKQISVLLTNCHDTSIKLTHNHSDALHV